MRKACVLRDKVTSGQSRTGGEETAKDREKAAVGRREAGGCTGLPRVKVC